MLECSYLIKFCPVGNSSSHNKHSRCPSDTEHLITRKSWKLRIEYVEITCEDKNHQMIHDGHVLPCYHSDGFRKPTTKTQYTFTWFEEEDCLDLKLQDFFEGFQT